MLMSTCDFSLEDPNLAQLRLTFDCSKGTTLVQPCYINYYTMLCQALSNHNIVHLISHKSKRGTAFSLSSFNHPRLTNFILYFFQNYIPTPNFLAKLFLTLSFTNSWTNFIPCHLGKFHSTRSY